MRKEQNPYIFPMLFVESESGDCWVCGNAYTFTQTHPCRPFKKIMYDTAIEELIDLEKGIVKRAFCIVSPNRDTAILVEQGKRVSLIEVKGKKAIVVIREGEKVEPRTVIGHTITSSGSSRTIRAGINGIVVLVGLVSHINPEHYIVAIAGEGDAKLLERGD